jgi:uncharacterized membrane protein required for colicin V production
MNWLLLVVIIILVVNALIGLKAGFIKTAFSLLSMIIALVLTLWISPYANNYMRGNDKICDYVSTRVEKILPMIEEKADKKAQESVIDKMSLPKSIKSSLLKNNNAEAYKKLSVNSFKDYMRSYLTGIILNALAFCITFIVLLILLWILSFALNIISKLPLLNQINKMAGLLVGLVHGLVVVWLLFILLTVFGSSAWGQKAMEMIGNDSILSLIYNNNFILKFITSASKMLK